MKIKFIIILTALVYFCNSCNKDEIDDNKKGHIIYGNTFESTIFIHGGGWTEVEYSESDPSQFNIHRYYTLSHDGFNLSSLCIHLITLPIISDVYRDSVLIGQVEYNIDYQVLFKGVDSDEVKLMYEFLPLLENRKQWDYDAYGGKTMVSLGSTAGVFTPITGSPASGYVREVLQCYKLENVEPVNIELYQPLIEKYGDSYLRKKFFRIDKKYYSGILLYINYDSTVSPYLPEDFWVQSGQ